MSDDFDDLNALLAESLQQQAEKKRVEDTRKELKSDTNLSSAEKEKKRSIILAFESRHEWETTAKVLVFTRHDCNSCGKSTTVFSHVMLHQIHREIPTRKRYVSASVEVLEESRQVGKDIPVKFGLQIVNDEACGHCVTMGDFDFEVAL